MSQKLTRITEITTGLGTIPDVDLSNVFERARPPAEIQGVDDETWFAIRSYWSLGSDLQAFEESFANGRHFLESHRALRSRPPVRVEWRGPHNLPEADPLPMDLRIDDVFVVSCKNYSDVLRNPSPARLFRHGDVTKGSRTTDWYAEIAPNEYNALLSAAGAFLGIDGLPDSPTQLDATQKAILKAGLKGRWPRELAAPVGEWVSAVSERSAASLNALLTTKDARARLYWQFLRLHSSTYFILGQQSAGAGRLQVLTPWDFKSRYRFDGLEIAADDAGQPQVRWSAAVFDSAAQSLIETAGHIEVRWSHRKFQGAPEGKIYIDTPHEQAAGYEPF